MPKSKKSGFRLIEVWRCASCNQLTSSLKAQRPIRCERCFSTQFSGMMTVAVPRKEKTLK